MYILYFVSQTDDGNWVDDIFTLDDVLEREKEFEDKDITFSISDKKHPNGNPRYIYLIDKDDNGVCLNLTDNREQNTLEVYFGNDCKYIVSAFMDIMIDTGKVNKLCDEDFYSRTVHPEEFEKVG